jgi:predicted HTH transcriptional regulator
LTILKEETMTEGYEISLEKAVNYVYALLPSKEDINAVRRTTNSMFPLPAIREAIANAIIHQDFFVAGAGPIVEIFENRVEVTNPGTPLVEIMRIIDNPPKSRNEKLASLMRRLRMCEELGRGWDRMVISCERQQLPAPRIQIYQDSTKVSLFSHYEFSNISMEDKLWSVYLHACVRFVEGDVLTNSSLRERFGLKVSSSGMMSRLIKEAMAQKLIKPIDPTTAPRYMKYIPIWA